MSLCMYNVSKFDGATILDVLRTHPYTLNKGILMENPYYQDPDIWLRENAPEFFGKTLKGTEIKDANDFSMYLLAEANVATVTGDAFGNPNCIRFSYATSDDILKEALRRIKEAVS